MPETDGDTGLRGRKRALAENGEDSMYLKNLAKKLNENDVPDMNSTIDGNIHLHDLSSEMFVSDTDDIFVRDESGKVFGKIEKEVLEFIYQKQIDDFWPRILDMSYDAIIAIDENGRIFYLNQAYVDILHVKPYRLFGKYIQDVEPGSLLKKVLETKKPAENKFQRIASLDRYVSVRIQPLFAENKFVGAVSFFRDITEIHDLNREVDKMTGIVDEYSRQIQRLKSLQSMGIVTQDRNFLKLLSQAEIVAQTDVPVLICGENGVGKEVLANYIHQCSERKNKPMITVNCAAIPADLMESELFGYEEGAFTGASKGGRKGKFELADKGTIFLDEIGDMPFLMQSKLLRVLQQGEIEKIGRQKRIPVDVRVIAATNQSMKQMIQAKKFRQDLYFRINTISMTIPALRDRPGDIPLLANQFLNEFNRKYNKNVVFSEETFEELLAYSWPGNVRELQNYVERSVILSNGAWKMPKEESKASKPDAVWDEPRGTLDEQVRRFEEKVILETLQHYDFNRSRAMEALGISRRTFYRKCARLDLKNE